MDLKQPIYKLHLTRNAPYSSCVTSASFLWDVVLSESEAAKFVKVELYQLLIYQGLYRAVSPTAL